MKQGVLHVNGIGDWPALRWRIGRSGPLEFAGLSVMGLFMAAFELFDAYPGVSIISILYWQCAMLGGGVIASLIEPVLYRRMTGKPRLFAVIQTLVMTPPITAWVWVVSNLFHGGSWNLRLLLLLAGSVLVVNVAVVVLAWVLRAAFLKQPPAPPASDAAPAAIRSRLSPRLARAPLVAVEAEDHYLRVHTEAGSDLILMRLADALSALEKHDGFQVHRSWWVARRAVETVSWKKGRGAMMLKGGLQAPVSQTFAPAVRAVDWG